MTESAVFTWEDFNGSRMVFASVEEMQAFLHWRSGRLAQQLEAADATLKWVADNYPAAMEAMPTYLYRALCGSSPASSPREDG